MARWNQASPIGQNGIELRSGCSGDGSPGIDLILDFDVSGAGRVSDILKTRTSPGPQNVDVTGRLAGCGPVISGDHQDGIQLQGGDGTRLVNMEVGGDYDGGAARCQGAGGALFFSLNNSQAIVLGGKYIGCNHSLTVHPGQAENGSRIEGAKFRSGNDETAFCSQFYTSSPCVIDDGTLDPAVNPESFVNVTCERWVNGRWAADRPR